jgi:hypothetical protein
MVIRRNPDGGRTAVALLATALVVFSGAVATAFIVLANAERATWVDWTVWSSLFLRVVQFQFSIRTRNDKEHREWGKFWLWWKRPNKDIEEEYMPTYRTPSRSAAPNKPPTLESVRELSEQSTNVLWVPSGNAPKRHNPKK